MITFIYTAKNQHERWKTKLLYHNEYIYFKTLLTVHIFIHP